MSQSSSSKILADALWHLRDRGWITRRALGTDAVQGDERGITILGALHLAVERSLDSLDIPYDNAEYGNAKNTLRRLQGHHNLTWSGVNDGCTSAQEVEQLFASCIPFAQLEESGI